MRHVSVPNIASCRTPAAASHQVRTPLKAKLASCARRETFGDERLSKSGPLWLCCKHGSYFSWSR